MSDELRFQVSLARGFNRPIMEQAFVISAPDVLQMRPPRIILDGRDMEAARARDHRDRFVQQMAANFARAFADALEAELEA